MQYNYYVRLVWACLILYVINRACIHKHLCIHNKLHVLLSAFVLTNSFYSLPFCSLAFVQTTTFQKYYFPFSITRSLFSNSNFSSLKSRKLGIFWIFMLRSFQQSKIFALTFRLNFCHCQSATFAFSVYFSL